jgi:CheY-like chemotaxis protein
MAKVFDPFFTTKPVGQGAGLGLSQVYGFARQSGGSAEIVSSPGQGTTVCLQFPLADAEAAHAAAEPVVDSTEGSASIEVLVVEDDASVRQGIVECLRLLRYTVREASDGADGLQALARNRPDLMLVDYLMPGMNGAELIAEARRLYPGMPILLATGYADMAQVEKVIGRQAVLAKPFDLETLGAAVATELRGSGATSQHRDAA